MVTYEDKTFQEVISGDEINRVVYKLANQIDTQYPFDEDLVFIGILKGAFIFLGDLIRAVNHQSQVTFVHLKSYEGMTSSGQIEVIKDIDIDIDQKHVIIVEDIIDTGNTMTQYYQKIQEKSPKSVSIYTLLSKPGNIRYEIPSFHVGFELSNNFVIGYGLDYNGWGRNLDGIYQLIE